MRNAITESPRFSQRFFFHDKYLDIPFRTKCMRIFYVSKQKSCAYSVLFNFTSVRISQQLSSYMIGRSTLVSENMAGISPRRILVCVTAPVALGKMNLLTIWVFFQQPSNTNLCNKAILDMNRIFVPMICMGDSFFLGLGSRLAGEQVTSVGNKMYRK
jgi:hypothetical protein